MWPSGLRGERTRGKVAVMGAWVDGGAGAAHLFSCAKIGVLLESVLLDTERADLRKSRCGSTLAERGGLSENLKPA